MVERTPSQEKKQHNLVRRLSQEETNLYVHRAWGHFIKQPTYTRRPESHIFSIPEILGLEIGGVNCLFVDIDHKKLTSSTQALISSPQTSIVVAEYFAPELQRRGVYKFKSLTQSVYQATQKLEFAQELTQLCQDFEKPVAVADIANNLWYPINRLGPSTLFPFAINFLEDCPWLVTGLLAYSLQSFGSQLQQFTGRGIFNKDKLSKFERLFIDLEQARRLFVAKGIEQIAQEVRDNNSEKTPKGTIVALYPRAHTIRIADMIEHPKPLKDTFRGLLYKGIAPLLDYSVRKYEYRHENGVDSDAWKLKSDTKIKLIRS